MAKNLPFTDNCWNSYSPSMGLVTTLWSVPECKCYWNIARVEQTLHLFRLQNVDAHPGQWLESESGDEQPNKAEPQLTFEPRRQQKAASLSEHATVRREMKMRINWLHYRCIVIIMYFSLFRKLCSLASAVPRRPFLQITQWTVLAGTSKYRAKLSPASFSQYLCFLLGLCQFAV